MRQPLARLFTLFLTSSLALSGSLLAGCSDDEGPGDDIFQSDASDVEPHPDSIEPAGGDTDGRPDLESNLEDE